MELTKKQAKKRVEAYFNSVDSPVKQIEVKEFHDGLYGFIFYDSGTVNIPPLFMEPHVNFKTKCVYGALDNNFLNS